MNFFIKDRNEETIAVLGNDTADTSSSVDVPLLSAIVSEKLTSYDILSLTIPAETEKAALIQEDFTVVFKDIKGWREYIITTIEEVDGEEKELTITAELSSIELLDDIVEVNLNGVSIQPGIVLEAALEGTRWQVGSVDESIYNQTFSVDTAFMSALEVINEVSAFYNAEVQFSYEVSKTGVSKRTVNLYKRFGEDTGKRFEMDKDIIDIVRTIDTTGLKTAIIPYGKEPSEEKVTDEETGEETTVTPKRLDITKVVWSKAKGDPVDKPLGQNFIGDPNALELWGKKNPDGSKRHRKMFMEIDVETDNALASMGWVQLNRYNMPKITYESTIVNLYALTQHEDYEHEKVNLGDTIRIIDHYFSTPLQVVSRIVEMERDLLDPINDKLVSGESKQLFSTSSVENSITDLKNKVDQINAVVSAPQVGADGAITYRGSDQPVNPSEGDIWFRPHPTKPNERQLLVFDGSAWQIEQDTSLLGAVKLIADQAKVDSANALEKANQAIVDATRASQEAGNVTNVADTAKENAQSALDKAQEAIANALAAQTEALTALDRAKAAKTAADNAQGKADLVGTDLATTKLGFQSDLDGFNQSITDYENQLATFQSTINGFKSQVLEYQVEVAGYEGTTAGHTTRVAQLENTITGFNSTVAQYTKDVNGFATKVSTLENTVKGFNSTVVAYQEQLTKYGTKVDGYTAQVSTLENTIEGFNSTVAGYQVEVDEYGNELVTYNQTVSALQNTIDGVKATVQNKADSAQLAVLANQVKTKVENADFTAQTQLLANQISSTVNQLKSVSSWVNEYSVNATTALPLTDIKGQPLVNSYSYDLQAGTLNTSTKTYALYTLKSKGSSNEGWELIERGKLGSGSNHPTIELNASGYPVVKTGHATKYTVSVTFNAFAGTETTSTVANTRMTQLSDAINLRVQKGDVITQINLSPESVLISGKKLILTGETTVDGTFKVTDQMIAAGISADKINVGTLNGTKVNIINLTADNITGGNLNIRNVTIMNGTTKVLSVNGTTGAVELNVSKLTINASLAATQNDIKDLASKSELETTKTGLNTTISGVKTTADGAKATADSAVENANVAKTTANSANAAANTANTNANAAKTTAGTAVTTANTAVSTANTANTNATAAKTTAANAETKANTAVSTANTAKTTADTAKSTADSANTKANTATTTAADATKTANNAAEIARSMGIGRMLYTDPNFREGLNSMKAYNNSGNGTVTIQQVAAPTGTPSDSGFVVEIKTTGLANPGMGGWSFQTMSRANAVFLTRIIANIPIGRSLTFASNATGTGGSTKWLTPVEGTGKWEEYVIKVTCGSTGTFSSTNFFYLNGGTFPVTWHVAYATTFDTTIADYSVMELQDRMTNAELSITPEAIASTVMSEDTFVTWKDEVDKKASSEDVADLAANMNTLDDQVTTIHTQMTNIEQTSANVLTTVTSVEEVVDGHSKTVNDVDAYMDFSTTGLEIGRSDSQMKVNISNSQIDFLDKGEAVAYINGQKLYITRAEILDSVTVGNHKIEKYANSNELTVVNWVGN